MRRPFSKYYFLCQLGGWAFLLGDICLVAPWALKSASIMVTLGLVFSHLLREIILRFGWLELPIKKGLYRIGVATAIICFAMALARWAIMLPFYGSGHLTLTMATCIAEVSLVILPWTGIYCLVQYLSGARHLSSKAMETEQRLTAIQHQAEQWSVDTGEILERLDRIGDLIEVDSNRSREEITEFSKLLRKGFMAQIFYIRTRF